MSQEGWLGLRGHSYLCHLSSNHNLFTRTGDAWAYLPGGTKIGVVVAAFNACSTPSLFRDAGNLFYGNEAISNTFYIFGLCHMHGIMDQHICRRQHDDEFNHLPEN